MVNTNAPLFGPGRVTVRKEEAPIFKGCVCFDVPVIGGVWVRGADGPLSDDGTTLSYDFTPDKRNATRVFMMAIERAIVNEYARDGAVCRALALRDPTFNRMAHRLGFSRPGGCYRGEQKQRKAMRRLLRATGLTLAPITRPS